MATLTLEPSETSVLNTPAANTRATIASEVPAPLSYHICVQSITASVTSDAAATSGAMTVVLRDGPTGTGTIVWACVLAAQTGSSAGVCLSGVNIQMSVGNVATLEFLAAGPGASLQSVAMTYYTDARIA